MLKTISVGLTGGGGGNGTVTQVGGTGTVNGITLTGNVTTTGNLTLGGTLANVTNSQLSNSAVTIGNTTVSLGGSTSSLGNLALNNVTVGATIANTGVFTTLTNTGTAYLGGASGNQSLQVNNVASAVNYAQIVGAVTGSAPLISAQGTDTNIGLVLTGKGTGVVALGGSTAANSAAQFVPTASSVNYVQFTGAATGISPSFLSTGTDAAVGFFLSTKGNANVNFGTNSFGNFSFVIKNVASAVNYLTTTGATTTNAPILSADGSDTNINLTLTPKGTGVVSTTATLKYAGVISGLTTKTANYTLVATDHTVLGNATTASFSLTLPTSVGATGQVYIIKKVDSTANTVTILTTSSQTIDGSSSKVLSYQYDGFQLQSDGANWMIIGNIFGRNGTVGTF
jgi:VCBS repeat-containing protein